MVNERLNSKKELFEKELNKLIAEFSYKRKKYYRNYIRLCWIMAIISAGLSFSVGISFLEEWEIHFKVLSLIFSSVLVVINSAMGFLNYKNLYEQRTKTLINLHLLKREYEFEVRHSDLENDLDKVYIKLQNLMHDDLDLWLTNVKKGKENEVKQC